MINEIDLIVKARQMDKTALAEIYDYYSPRLYRYTARQLGDSDQAEDIVAETFRRFLHTLYRGGGPEKHLQAYLFLHGILYWDELPKIQVRYESGGIRGWLDVSNGEDR